MSWRRNTALFLASQTLSLLGTMIVQYAIMWHLVLETGSGVMMTLYVVVGVLPTFFSSIFGGVLADRYDKKLLINLSDGGIGLVSLLFALFLFSGHDSIVLLLVAAGLRALGQGVQQPTVGSLVPLIVPEDKLLKINGLNSSLQSGIFIISPIAAAALMAVVPLGALFLVDVVTALGAISILYFFVKVPPVPGVAARTEKNSYFKDLTEGLRYIRSERYLLLLIVMSICFTIAISPAACLSPLQVTRDFGPELWRLTAIEIVWAGGMVVGGLLVGVWSFRNRIHSVGVSSVVTGVGLALLGVWTDFSLYLACMAVCGVVQTYSQAPSMTILQEKVAPEFLGRVMSVFTMIGSLAMPVGIMVFGPLADVVSIDGILIATGSAIVLLGACVLSNRTLRAAGRPIYFSMCEWGTSKPWKWAAETGHSWRTTGDIYNCFDCIDQHPGFAAYGVLQILDMQEGLRKYAGPGHWNDPDMLEVGNGQTVGEDRAHFTLWCMLAAPLILGNDLRNMSQETKDIILNKEAIAIDQDKLGVQGLKLKAEDGLEFWFKPLAGGDWAFCILNRTTEPKTYTIDWQKFNFTDEEVSKLSTDFDKKVYTVRNLWTKDTKKSVEGNTKKIKQVTIPGHDVLLYRLSEQVKKNKR